MAESFVISVASSIISTTLNSIATLAWDKIKFLGDVPKKVQLIEAKMRLIQSYVKDAEKKPQKSHLTANWLREMKRVTYQAQDAIERMHHLLQHHPNRSRFLRYIHNNNPSYLKDLHHIGEEIDRINNFIPEISRMVNDLNVVNLGQSSSMADQSEHQQSRDPRKTIYLDEGDEVIGFESEINKIINEIIGETYEPLIVVSLVGMGGIGKTTLAKKVSNHSDIKRSFDIIALVTVSKEYNVLNLIKEILKATNKYKDEDLEKMTEEEARCKLSSAIEGKKYLIVIDDIWETKSWDEINYGNGNTTFPNENNGSRILMTTRNRDVANYPNLRTSIHEVKLLNYEQSLKLLKKKAFPPYVKVNDAIKKELESLCLRLIQKCNGLPLALIVLGGYLSKHLDPQTWSKMAEYVDWKEAGNQIDISNILALSYHDLPTNLKQAFLYITVFPEDQIIECSDLIRLWIAEGFVPPTNPSTRKCNSETSARTYIDQLYERGLVQIVERSRVHGWISRIRIHDVLRDWGIKRASDEESFYVIKNFDDLKHCATHNSYRVALHGYCNKEKVNSLSNLRTIMGFELSPQSDLFRGLNNLRVISLTHKEYFIKSPEYIKHMILLRYICLRKCNNVHFPSSMGEIYNLETLECKKSSITSLPSSLWEISTLRHVYLQWICCNWNGPKKGSGQNLQTLIIYEWGERFIQKTTTWFYTGMEGVAIAVEDMKQIVHLQLDAYINPLPENLLSKFSGLEYLEVLELMNPIKRLTRIPNTFPPNILKITLHTNELVEDPMPILQMLSKLVELRLLHGNKLKTMHCSINGFPRLKYLIIESFSVLEDWTIDLGASAMPSLCHLGLSKCNKLKEFPRRLMEHDQLQLVRLYSVRQLSEVDYSNLERKGCKVEIIN